ncbi:Protein of unknown function [Gryllus bimaculatus]|nr:Protein of unknown function [Gryllus bimaculatus]
MSEISNLTSFSLHSQVCEQKLNEPVNQMGRFTVSGISKIKAEEIKHLLASVKLKHEKYNLLQQYDSKSDLPVKVIKKELLEKYAFNMNCHDYNPQANILFGLSEIDVDGGASTERLRFPGEDRRQTSDLSKSMRTGFQDELNFHPKILLKRFQVLKAMVALHNEQVSTLSCLEECKFTAMKVQELLLLKQQTAIKAAETYHKGLLSLFIDAQLLKYSVLKDYFSEDKAVVDASIKLRELIASDFENLRWKEIDLQKKIEDFKQLKGPRFDQLLREYKLVCESISNKEWTLQNLL